jgi:cobalt-zinc-cadmium efflux system membrane fusion protein
MMRLIRNIFIFLAVAGALGAAAYHFHRVSISRASAPSAHGHGHGASHEGHDHGAEAPVMSEAKMAAAGIELETAGPGTLRETLRLNGILQPNQEALVQITPRFPGVIRELRKRVGDAVAAGEVLAKIESNQSLTSYELKAPMAGTVIDRQAALGEFASEQKAVFTVADLTSVWADFSVYRRDLAKVAVGNRIIIDAEDGGEPIEAKIAYLSPVGSSDTQSALARVTIPNPKARLRPGLFVTGKLLLAEKPVAVAVKSAALQTMENRTVVFVRAGEKFETREVEIGARDDEHVEVLFGVLEGDQYAAKNSFVIKAEIGKASAAHEH